ncbi:MAG: AAA family ATPase [bacterium]|nr:AAA family ATPase [bacterium]
MYNELKKIRIEGFRRLCEIEIEMRPLMVLIGANGAGKTSFLEAMSLLSASAAGTMNRTLNLLGGVSDLCTRGLIPDLTLSAEMNCPGYEPLEYQLKIEPSGQGYAIPLEILSQKREGDYAAPFKHIESTYNSIRYYDINERHLGKPDWEHNFLETSLSQVPKMFRQPEELRRTLSSTTQYHVLNVGRNAPVKLPQQMKPARLPGEDGEDLVPFLYNLRESDTNRYEAIEDTLKSAFPGFEKLLFPPSAAGMLSLTWKEKQFRDPIYIHQLSEGTLRFLWLVSLLQSPNLTTITMIDEPEVSLHPELLSLLADLMREASKRTQIIVATHSDRLIRFLEPHEVVVMDISEVGYAQMQWADTMQLDEWLKEYSLDDAWRMGQMGGRA